MSGVLTSVFLCAVSAISAVNNGFKYTHRRDAENAEAAQRISKPGYYPV
jgi:hypothetical protein